MVEMVLKYQLIIANIQKKIKKEIKISVKRKSRREEDSKEGRKCQRNRKIKPKTTLSCCTQYNKHISQQMEW